MPTTAPKRRVRHHQGSVEQSTPTPLQVSELRYRRLFEDAQDGILILDLSTLKILDANPYIQKLLGYSKDELVDKELWEIGLLKDQVESQDLYLELQERGFIRYEGLPLQSKDGQPHEVEFISNVYQEGDHSVIQCNIRDISARKRADHDLREKLVQTEKLKLLGEMARGVAHDLNQSLAMVSGYSDLVMAALTESPVNLGPVGEMVEVIAQAATDGGQIVSRLLTFARGQPEGPAEEVSVPALLAQVERLTVPRWREATQAEGRPITLTVDAEPDTVILGWPASLREALVNLVFNAIDALPEGGTICLRAHQHGKQVDVEVQDSGTGMSSEVQSQVFRPLFTTKGSHGTGLGLAQVLSTVEQHGGQISIDSTLGHGTTFCLVFPAAHASSLAILVVDDEPALADLIARMLRLEGHVVVAMNSGAAALERLSTESFDLVISDMSMPGMNGWEFTTQVRSRYPTTPLMIASGWGSQITPAEARERGIHAVLAKPYRRTDLQKTLASLDASHRVPSVLRRDDPVGTLT